MTAPEPQFGTTRHGFQVHARTRDYHPGGSAAARFNKRAALVITLAIGTMWAAYGFALLSLLSLPAILTEAFHLHVFPQWLINTSLISLVAWVSSYFLQLVLLPVIMVGQNLQSVAGDARAAKTFEDVEAVLDRLDLKTAGSLAEVYGAVREAQVQLAALATQITAIQK